MISPNNQVSALKDFLSYLVPRAPQAIVQKFSEAGAQPGTNTQATTWRALQMARPPSLAELTRAGAEVVLLSETGSSTPRNARPQASWQSVWRAA